MTLSFYNQVNSNLGLLMAGFALLFVYISVVLGNFNWIRRRTLLMSLLAAQQRAGDVKRTSTVTTATGDDEVLRRMAVLPEALWEGIFRFM